MNVTAEAAQVGQMLLHALQNAVGMGPDEALQSAQAEAGVTNEQIDGADMGEVFEYMCAQPGIDANLQGFLTNQASNYNNYGNVSQGGSSYSGGGGGYSGGGGGASAGASNTQIVQQVTQNYNYQEINDNHIDILGPVNGNIDIDQDNDDIDVEGDGNAVNSGSGDQNAATGEGSSAAQSGFGDAVSNSGDGAITAGDDVDIDAPVNTGVFTGVQTDSGDVENSPVGNGNQVVDLEDADIHDSALGFGAGDTGNVSGNYLEEGAAASGTGDATGQSVDTNVQSNVDEEHGPGHQVELDHGPRVLEDQPDFVRSNDGGGDEPGHDGGHGGGVNDNLSDNFSPVVNVNVEGGAGDQTVDDLDPADA